MLSIKVLSLAALLAVTLALPSETVPEALEKDLSTPCATDFKSCETISVFKRESPLFPVARYACKKQVDIRVERDRFAGDSRRIVDHTYSTSIFDEVIALDWSDVLSSQKMLLKEDGITLTVSAGKYSSRRKISALCEYDLTNRQARLIYPVIISASS